MNSGEETLDKMSVLSRGFLHTQKADAASLIDGAMRVSIAHVYTVKVDSGDGEKMPGPPK